MSGILRRNDLDRMMYWLGNTLAIGPGMGDVFFVAPAASAYETWFKKMGVKNDHLFATPALGYAATTDDRNDVVCVAPGTYTVTAELDWTKRYTHLVGLGGPNQRGYDTYGTQMYSDTITVARLIHLTGQRCQFHNITIANNGANATCLSAFANAGYGTILKNVQLIGMMNSTQAQTTLASSLELLQYGGYLYAENCIFGTTEWAVQNSTSNAPILFSNTVDGQGPADGKFLNCKIQAAQAGTDHPLIHAPNNNGIGRDWIFDRCEFYAFVENHVGACAQVITEAGNVKTHDVVFKNCSGINITKWKTTTNGCTWASGGTDIGTSGVAVTAA
jgi:hypothetical protein